MKKSLLPLASLLTLAVVVTPATAYSQASPTRIELGIDGGVATKSGSGLKTMTDVELPVQTFRIGFFVSDNVSIEPMASLSHTSGDGSFTTWETTVGVLFLTGDHKSTQYYLRPFVGVTGMSGTNLTSSTPFHAGAAVGVKIPMYERLSTLFDVGYERQMDSGDIKAGNVFFGTIGLSFHTW